MKADESFFEKVYDMVRKIPYGRVSSYGEIAEAIGMKGSSRMVGWAMNASHSQTIPVPAHRVVNRNGMLTGKHHFASPTLMQELLQSEGIEVNDDKVVNFKELFFSFKATH
jgi:methylated-DNA-protein-cysteine methyltransferase-like protein